MLECGTPCNWARQSLGEPVKDGAIPTKVNHLFRHTRSLGDSGYDNLRNGALQSSGDTGFRDINPEELSFVYIRVHS